MNGDERIGLRLQTVKAFSRKLFAIVHRYDDMDSFHYSGLAHKDGGCGQSHEKPICGARHAAYIPMNPISETTEGDRSHILEESDMGFCNSVRRIQ